MTMSKIIRKILFVDESRIWNLEEPAAGVTSDINVKIRSFLTIYMWWEIHVEAILRVTENSKNLSSVSLIEKNTLLRTVSGYYHNSARKDNFYCFQPQYRTVLYTGRSVIPSQILFHENKFARIFVPKFYHDKRDANFLKFLSYVGEHGPDNVRCEYPQIGRKLYKYKKKTAGSSAGSIQLADLVGHFQKYI